MTVGRYNAAEHIGAEKVARKSASWQTNTVDGLKRWRFHIPGSPPKS